MDWNGIDTALGAYEWKLSLLTGAGIFAVVLVINQLYLLVPAIRGEVRRNKDAYAQKMENPRYAANQRWNMKWSPLYLAIIFGGILPWCLTLDSQPWWQALLDMAVILMFYDFFYYLTHRFLFHDSGFFGGPLKWMHGVHHRQHNPCRKDSSYIHPLEVAIGLGLYAASIFVLSRVMGDFHVLSIVVTWVAFTEINLHNHNLWETNRFGTRYLDYAAKMHHHHHARFTGGNFATITLLFDWMFGSLDHGKGWGAEKARIEAREREKAMQG